MIGRGRYQTDKTNFHVGTNTIVWVLVTNFNKKYDLLNVQIKIDILNISDEFVSHQNPSSCFKMAAI